MSKKIKKLEQKASNEEEKMLRAADAVATDNQNVNRGHNVKKQALGPNTKR